MSDTALDKAKAVALTTARLETMLHAARNDEALLKRVLEVRRMKRRLKRVAKSK